MIGHLVLSLVLAGAVLGILLRGLRFRPNRPVWSLLIIFVLWIWAGGAWATVVGPSHLGIYWVPFLLSAILLAILVAVLAPHGYRDDREIQREVKAGLDLVFWVLIGALTVLIVARYR